MTPLTVGVVGAGIIGANHVAALRRHPRFEVVALADPAPSFTDGLAVYDGVDSLLAAGPPDLVVICTPSGQHGAQALAAIAAGCHVVVEKPIDVSVAAATPLVLAAREAAGRGQVVSVISQHRFDPATIAVAGAARDGLLGRLTSAVASVPWWRAQEYYDSATWRGTVALDGGGALMNQGVHTVDLLVHLMGRPVEISAYTATLSHTGIEVEDVAAAVLRFASGALATLHATTAASPGLGVRLQIHGDAGSAVIENDLLTYASFPSPVAGAPAPADAFVAGHLRQYEDVAGAIDAGRPPAVTADDGLLALAVVEAVYRSAAEGRPVTLEGIRPS
jgi:UDP-N-acetyl-2-amino-2-deoxyglucuronate dehydrogenase